MADQNREKRGGWTALGRPIYTNGHQRLVDRRKPDGIDGLSGWFKCGLCGLVDSGAVGES